MSLILIGSFIDNNDPSGLIHCYLTCMALGFTLPCPTNSNKSDLFDAWEKILAKHRNDFTDEFCAAVSNEWYQLLTQCNPEKPIPTQLFTQANIQLDSLQSSKPSNAKNTQSDIPTKQPYANDSLTKPEISEQYHQRHS